MARFENGELKISIVQQFIDYKDEQQVRLVDNWGVTKELKSKFRIPKMKEKFFQINYDSIYDFYEYYGLTWDGIKRDNGEYLHLEVNYD